MLVLILNSDSFRRHHVVFLICGFQEELDNSKMTSENRSGTAQSKNPWASSIPLIKVCRPVLQRTLSIMNMQIVEFEECGPWKSPGSGIWSAGDSAEDSAGEPAISSMGNGAVSALTHDRDFTIHS